MLNIVLVAKKVLVKDVQRLCGVLNVFSKAIIPARAFTRRLYMMTMNKYHGMKAHHHVRLSDDVRMDLMIWQMFLKNPLAYARPFADFSNEWTAEDLDLFTDSSANPEFGCGGHCGSEWFNIKWDSTFIIENKPSINYLELFAVTVAVFGLDP